MNRGNTFGSKCFLVRIAGVISADVKDTFLLLVLSCWIIKAAVFFFSRAYFSKSKVGLLLLFKFLAADFYAYAGSLKVGDAGYEL